MARYLLVANQTIQTPELVDAALRLQDGDLGAEFALVVPATRVVRGLIWDEVETKVAARAALEAGLTFLRAAGCRVVDGQVGDEDPVLAVEDELRRTRYRGVIVSTLPPGISRWLRLDVLSRLKRRLSPTISIVHVFGQSSSTRTAPSPEPTRD